MKKRNMELNNFHRVFMYKLLEVITLILSGYYLALKVYPTIIALFFISRFFHMKVARLTEIKEDVITDATT